MKYNDKFIDKEISWLAFNARVLQEAADEDVPVIERARFLGIYSNNMDEFYRVRFAEVKRKLLINDGSPNAFAHADLLARIQKKVLKLQERFDEVYSDILFLLARRNIFLVNESQILPEQKGWVKKYFRDEILPSLVPLFVTTDVNLGHCLMDDLTYLAVEINPVEQPRQYAVLEVPSDEMTRFIQLPKQKDGRRKTIVMLDNVIRYCLNDLFKGIVGRAEYSAYAFKLTRDADYLLGDDIDESLMDRMSDGLKQRLTATPVRFVYDREMPPEMLNFFINKLKISSYDSIIPGGRYHNFKDFMKFPAVGPKYLLNHKLRSLDCRAFDKHRNCFAAMREQDILLYYPYHKFRYFTEFVRQAAFDPQVRSIKLSIYRVARDSQLINSLILAKNNNKDVTVVVELQARFDEAANIEWAKKLTDARVKVEFGLPSLKIHSKICLIERMEDGELVRYSHVGTGNFHEGTARVYTDFSLFTFDQEIGVEVEQVFDTIAHMYKRYSYKHLITSPHDTRKRLRRLIKEEMDTAAAGKKAEIMFKINNLTDPEMIDNLYKASQAGVKVRLIIRGMCCLIPGVKGLSDNIKVISIVDRFLEHPRVFVFHSGGDKKVFISSADIMSRNLDQRIEVGCPIYDQRLKNQILDILEIQWKDTMKARIIDAKQSNKYVPRGNRKKIRSQIAIHDYLKAL